MFGGFVGFEGFGGFDDQHHTDLAEAEPGADPRDAVVSCRQEDGSRSRDRASAASAAVSASARPGRRPEESVPTPTISLTPASG